MLFCLHLFLNVAVFCFDNCQIGIICSAKLWIFVNGQEITSWCMTFGVQPLMLCCLATFKFNVLCRTQHPTLKSDFENNQQSALQCLNQHRATRSLRFPNKCFKFRHIIREGERREDSYPFRKLEKIAPIFGENNLIALIDWL